ncbi:MAG: signal peptidase II [Phycisphaerae bacterium]|nr:signal peptidase II [Phycisphaerae bacterium]MBT5656753.1 signal peptidase II [Phycisphaerae bacterium]
MSTTPTSAGPSPPRLRPARTSVTAWLLLILVAGGGLSLDLTSKQWAFESVAAIPVEIDRDRAISDEAYNPIPPHAGVQAMPADLLDFRLVLNSGAVFGIGAHQRWFFVAFSMIAVGVAVWIFGWRTHVANHLLHIGIALILAGALGNLWDRLMLGRVRDFLHMLPGWKLPFGLAWPGGNPEMWPWIFNVADVMLLLGMAVVFIAMRRVDERATSPKS